MKLQNLKIELQSIPLKTPFITALRRVENVEFVRVYLYAHTGEVGIGEAPATKAITGEDLDDIVASLKSITNTLLNQELQSALELLHQSSIGSSAKAALDMAIISLLAQEKKQKMYEYLGGLKPSVLQTDITVSLKSQSLMLADAISYVNEGMDILKVKLGSDIKHAIEVTHAIAKQLPSAKLIIDANQAWNLEQSLEYIEAVKDVSIELIEQPVIAKDTQSLKLITQKSHIPILADEAVFTLADAKKVIEDITKSFDS